jgi:hypothetical protein
VSLFAEERVDIPPPTSDPTEAADRWIAAVEQRRRGRVDPGEGDAARETDGSDSRGGLPF